MADRNDLIFIDANGEITNSTSADTLVYSGIKSLPNILNDASPSDSITLSTGNKTAGSGNSGSIDLLTGSSTGGSKGSVFVQAKNLIVNGANGTHSALIFADGNDAVFTSSDATAIDKTSFEGAQGTDVSGGDARFVGGNVFLTSDVVKTGGSSSYTSGTSIVGSTAGVVHSGDVFLGSADAFRDGVSSTPGANSGNVAIKAGLPAGTGTQGFVFLDGQYIATGADFYPQTTNTLNIGNVGSNFSSVHANLLTSDGILSLDTSGVNVQIKVGGNTKLAVSSGQLSANVDIGMNSNKVIGLAAGTAATDAVNKSQLDGALQGLSAKKAARVATLQVLPGTMIADGGTPLTTERAYDLVAKTITWFASEGPLAIDGITLANGDRILVKDESATSGPAAGEGRKYNGIYIRTSQDVWTRSTDFDEVTPINEIQGAYVPVQLGTANEAKFFVQSGTVSTLDTDNINFVFFNAIATGISGGAGIANASGLISADLAALGGLKLIGAGNAAQIGVDYAADFTIGAGDNLPVSATSLTSTSGAGSIGILDSGSYYAGNSVEAALQESAVARGVNATNIGNNTTAINQHALDLASTTNGVGASLIGVEDAAGNFLGTTQELVNAELFTLASAVAAESYITDTGYTSVKGDLLYISTNDKVKNVDTTGAAPLQVGFSLAGTGGVAPGASVEGKHDGQVLTAVLPAGFTAGDRVYYDSSQVGSARFVPHASAPSATGTRVWIVGTAKNTTDLVIDINYIKRNA